MLGWPSIVPSFCAPSMLAVSAEANTSAFAPCASCVRSVGEPAKFMVSLAEGLASSMSVFILLKASVRDAAANTVRLPWTVLAPAADPAAAEPAGFTAADAEPAAAGLAEADAGGLAETGDAVDAATLAAGLLAAALGATLGAVGLDGLEPLPQAARSKSVPARAAGRSARIVPSVIELRPSYPILSN